MPRSLLFRLLGAFAPGHPGAGCRGHPLANRATAGQFRVYTDRNGQLWAQRLAPTLANYYARTGSWQGVDATLRSSSSGTNMMGGGMMDGGMDGEMMGGWMGEGMDTRSRQQSSGAIQGAQGAAIQQNWNMWDMMGQRLLIADARGSVMADSQDALVGKALSAQELAEGQPVLVNGQRVGTVIVAPASAGTPPRPRASFSVPSIARSSWPSWRPESSP